MTDAIEIIENALVFYAEEGISSDKDAQKDLDKAWSRVKELARKGEIAEKHLKEWGRLK
tara:strand:+ start:658 stop:834 length:177 start_codon:yes stop_codon:yes gene_type:complete